MRALHVSHSAQSGGSNEVLLSLLRHRPEGSECRCVFLDGGPMLGRCRELGVPAVLVPSGRAREPWRAPGAVRGLRREIERFGADVVLAHVSKAHLYAWAASRLAGVPEGWWQQERLTIKPALQRVAGRLRADAVICAAQDVADDQARRFPATPVRRIPLGPETDGLGPPREHRAGAGDAVALGLVSRLQRWKRVELALQAMPLVLEAVPGARLTVMGDAAPGVDEDYPAELRAETARLGIEHAVEFAGHVPGAASRMAQFDVLVHAARAEPFGLVLIEAMLRGVPVVAPDEGGPREILRDGVDGLVVDVTDARAFGEAVARLAGDPERRARMGAAGRARALERYTAQRMAAQAWELLAELSGDRPRQPAHRRRMSLR